MIRLGKLTDYGIVLMTYMARNPERVLHTAAELARESRLPSPTVSQILKQLARAGLLVSHRGVKGGFNLGRPPHTISVAEIIEALEGPIALTECSLNLRGLCDLEPHCPTANNWRVISRAVRTALENLTLRDLTHSFDLAAARATRQSNIVSSLILISGRPQ